MTVQHARTSTKDEERVQVLLQCSRCGSQRFAWETIAEGCHHCGCQDLRLVRYYVFPGGNVASVEKPYKLLGLLIIWDEHDV